MTDILEHQLRYIINDDELKKDIEYKQSLAKTLFRKFNTTESPVFFNLSSEELNLLTSENIHLETCNIKELGHIRNKLTVLLSSLQKMLPAIESRLTLLVKGDIVSVRDEDGLIIFGKMHDRDSDHIVIMYYFKNTQQYLRVYKPRATKMKDKTHLQIITNYLDHIGIRYTGADEILFNN